MSSTGLSSITWNAAGQPATVTALSGSPIAGTYDALGRLVETAQGSAYTQFVFSPGGAKLAVIRSGALSKATIPLPGGETAVYNASGLEFIRHTDWLGSSRLGTTWAHAVYSKESYAPFGETYNEAGTPDRSFTGQDQDTVTGSGATGVYDFMFRKYDPAAGRWISPDPYGWGAVDQNNPQSLNRYEYALDNPTIYEDPDGLASITFGSCTVYYTTWGVSASDTTGTNVSDSGFDFDGTVCNRQGSGGGSGGSGGGSGGSGGGSGGSGSNNGATPSQQQQDQQWHEQFCAAMKARANAAGDRGELFGGLSAISAGIAWKTKSEFAAGAAAVTGIVAGANVVDKYMLRFEASAFGGCTE